MKANRKFLNNDDEAVSPVIAVILMVAITVVLAATVYVWVSGFGAQSSSPAKSIALTSAGQIVEQTAGVNYTKSYVVASASPGMLYQDMSLTIGGQAVTWASTNCVPDPGEWSACAASARAATDIVQAGDTIVIAHGSSPSSLTLRILDPNSNSVMLTLTVS